jgi:hypothetical protein
MHQRSNATTCVSREALDLLIDAIAAACLMLSEGTMAQRNLANLLDDRAHAVQRSRRHVIVAEAHPSKQEV